MNNDEIELNVSRIITGDVIILWNNEELLIKKPDRIIKYRAEILYQNKLNDAKNHGFWDEEELLEFMVDSDLWNNENEKILNKINSDIPDFKIKLYENYYKEESKQSIKKIIFSAVSKQKEYLIKRHSYDHLTDRGYALTAKNRFLISNCVYDILGNKITRGLDIDQLYYLYSKVLLGDSDIRTVAKSDIWKNIWNNRKCSSSLFGGDVVDMTDEQKMLASWSSFYDSIQEHPEKPSDQIIYDDDAFDGWLLKQRKDKEVNDCKKDIEGLIDKKIANAQEVFIPLNKADKKFINSMNSDRAKKIKEKRFQAINDKGVLNHIDLPDVKREVQMQANRMNNG